MLEKAIQMIEEQQGTEDKNPRRWMIGEQVKDICRREPEAAELVAQDLENPGMSLEKLEKKFDSFATAHKRGNCAIITPKQGEQLIREFFGIPVPTVAPVTPTVEPEAAPRTSGKVFSLFDLI